MMPAPKRDCSEMESGNSASGVEPPSKRKHPSQDEIAYVVKAKVALLSLAVQREALRQQLGEGHERLREIDLQMESYKATLREKKILGCDFTTSQENYIRIAAQRRVGH